MKQAVICFTRVPRPGQTKTRLLGLLTPEQCARLHWAFLRDLAKIYPTVDADLFVAYTPDPEWVNLAAVFPYAAGYFPQEGTDLGEKMYNAIAKVLSMGDDRVVLTGGIAHSKYVAEQVGRMTGFLAPLEVVAGEFEMEALALGALRVLKGEEEPKTYL